MKRNRDPKKHAEFDIMLLNQDNKCAICGDDSKNNIRRGKILPLFIDHDHKTGKIRGLLCVHCNYALGHFKDDMDKLRKSLEYLEKYK